MVEFLIVYFVGWFITSIGMTNLATNDFDGPVSIFGMTFVSMALSIFWPIVLPGLAITAIVMAVRSF